MKSLDRRRKRIVFRREGRGGELEVVVRADDGRLACSQAGETGREWEARIEAVIWEGISEEEDIVE